MTNPESPDRAALLALGEELAGAHPVETLVRAFRVKVYERLREVSSAGVADDRKALSFGFANVARTLIARLRSDGHGDVADGVASAMASLFKFKPPEDDSSIRMRNEWVARVRAEGRPADAAWIHTGELYLLWATLDARLHADGHDTLAEAVRAAWAAFQQRCKREAGPGRSRHDRYVPPPPVERTADVILGDELAGSHRAEALACALLLKLRAAGDERFAGWIMVHWLHLVAGPVVDPRATATALVARFRAEEHDEVADAIEPLLRDAAIERDIGEITALSEREVAGPLVAPGSLALALIDHLRTARRDEIADTVLALTKDMFNGGII